MSTENRDSKLDKVNYRSTLVINHIKMIILYYFSRNPRFPIDTWDFNISFFSVFISFILFFIILVASSEWILFTETKLIRNWWKQKWWCNACGNTCCYRHEFNSPMFGYKFSIQHPYTFGKLKTKVFDKINVSN